MASQSFQLIMRSGPTPGKVFELSQGELYIGRDVGNDIVVNDSEVSRKHARLVLQTGGYMLEDLGSTNGTFVNGQRLMGPHVLRPGELIMLGENISMAYELGYDVDATVVAVPAQPVYAPPPPPPAPRQTYVPPPVQAAPQRPPAQPAYTGQVPQGPAETYFEEQPETQRPNRRTLLLAGCGCLLLALCGIVAILFFVDSMNLWCQVPFRFLSFLYPLVGGVPCP
jgi:hypothetical protein